MNTCSTKKKKQIKYIEKNIVIRFQSQNSLFSRFPFGVFLYYLQLTVHLVNQHVL